MTHEFRQTSRADGFFGRPHEGFSTKGNMGEMGWKSIGAESGGGGRCGCRSRVDGHRGVLCVVVEAGFLVVVVVVVVGSEELGLLE